MATQTKIQNVIFNLNNVYAVHNVSYNEKRKSFDFFYNEEIQRKNLAINNGDCYIYEQSINGDFANNKYKAGEYIQSLFKQLDLNIEGYAEIK